MLEQFGTNPSQLIGVLSFALTTWACLYAARSSNAREARVWKLLSIVNAFCLLELIIGFRFRILEFARATLKQEGVYDQLHGRVQAITVAAIATGALLLAAVFIFSRVIPGGPAKLAAGMTVVIPASFATEMISLHELYPVLYRQIGPLITIAWIWIGAAAGICFAALYARWRKNSVFRYNA